MGMPAQRYAVVEVLPSSRMLTDESPEQLGPWLQQTASSATTLVRVKRVPQQNDFATTTLIVDVTQYVSYTPGAAQSAPRTAITTPRSETPVSAAANTLSNIPLANTANPPLQTPSFSQPPVSSPSPINPPNRVSPSTSAVPAPLASPDPSVASSLPLGTGVNNAGATSASNLDLNHGTPRGTETGFRTFDTTTPSSAADGGSASQENKSFPVGAMAAVLAIIGALILFFAAFCLWKRSRRKLKKRQMVAAGNRGASGPGTDEMSLVNDHVGMTGKPLAGSTIMSASNHSRRSLQAEGFAGPAGHHELSTPSPSNQHKYGNAHWVPPIPPSALPLRSDSPNNSMYQGHNGLHDHQGIQAADGQTVPGPNAHTGQSQAVWQGSAAAPVGASSPAKAGEDRTTLYSSANYPAGAGRGSPAVGVTEILSRVPVGGHPHHGVGQDMESTHDSGSAVSNHFKPAAAAALGATAAGLAAGSIYDHQHPNQTDPNERETAFPDAYAYGNHHEGVSDPFASPTTPTRTVSTSELETPAEYTTPPTSRIIEQDLDAAPEWAATSGGLAGIASAHHREHSSASNSRDSRPSSDVSESGMRTPTLANPHLHTDKVISLHPHDSQLTAVPLASDLPLRSNHQRHSSESITSQYPSYNGAGPYPPLRIQTPNSGRPTPTPIRSTHDPHSVAAVFGHTTNPTPTSNRFASPVPPINEGPTLAEMGIPGAAGFPTVAGPEYGETRVTRVEDFYAPWVKEMMKDGRHSMGEITEEEDGGAIGVAGGMGMAQRPPMPQRSTTGRRWRFSQGRGGPVWR